MARMRPVSHEDQLSLVEHLDELRTRIVVCLVVLGIALALCFWQNHLLLEIASGPLPSDHKKLLTFGITEPFTVTLTVSVYGALILSMPVLLYQAYAYVLPAFSDRERRVVLPILIFAPVLFLAGVAFSVLRRDAGRGQVPAQLQRQPVQRPGPGARLLQLLLDHDAGRRRHLPAAAGDPRRRPARHRQRRAALQEPPLRLPGRSRSSPPRCPGSTRSRCCSRWFLCLFCSS